MARFKVTTAETVHRTYTVEAEDEDQAKKRLRMYYHDAAAVGAGIVTGPETEEPKTRIVRAVEAAPDPDETEAVEPDDIGQPDYPPGE